jgi:hypothetical protein
MLRSMSIHGGKQFGNSKIGSQATSRADYPLLPAHIQPPLSDTLVMYILGPKCIHGALGGKKLMTIFPSQNLPSKMLVKNSSIYSLIIQNGEF